MRHAPAPRQHQPPTAACKLPITHSSLPVADHPQSLPMNISRPPLPPPAPNTHTCRQLSSVPPARCAEQTCLRSLLTSPSSSPSPSSSRNLAHSAAMTSRMALRFAQKARELIALPPAEITRMTQPTCVGGVWRAPYLRPRKVSRLRQIAAAEGLVFPLPVKDPRPPIRWKPNKGRKWEREREARCGVGAPLPPQSHCSWRQVTRSVDRSFHDLPHSLSVLTGVLAGVLADVCDIAHPTSSEAPAHRAGDGGHIAPQPSLTSPLARCAAASAGKSRSQTICRRCR